MNYTIGICWNVFCAHAVHWTSIDVFVLEVFGTIFRIFGVLTFLAVAMILLHHLSVCLCFGELPLDTLLCYWQVKLHKHCFSINWASVIWLDFLQFVVLLLTRDQKCDIIYYRTTQPTQTQEKKLALIIFKSLQGASLCIFFLIPML